MNIDRQLLQNLEEEYGDSFYILDLQRFQDNYREFLTSFRSIYPNSNIAYSYKTNYIPVLCRQVNLMGGYAEVVSQLEYELAERVGVPSGRIVFNGPLKLAADIERAILAGSIVNLDSRYEVSIVQALARRLPEHDIPVGLRCNLDIGAGFVSRFGFDVESGELERVFKTLKGIDNCQVQGLHFHCSSPRTVESYSLRAKKMVDLVTALFRDAPPRFVDLGGGFSGKMDEVLRKQFDYPVPSYQDYAEAIAPQFASVFPRCSGPELILEPGVALVADVVRFVAKVVDVKVVQSRAVALSTGSVHNVKPTLHKMNLPMRVYGEDGDPSRDGDVQPVDIVGYTCMEHDCLYHGYQGTVSVGDYMVFDNVGAYTVVFKPPFIRPSPAIVAYDSLRDEYELVRREEGFEDLFRTYLTGWNDAAGLS